MQNLVWQIGEITIQRLIERESIIAAGGERSALQKAFPSAIREIPWMIPYFATQEGHLRMNVHALLVQTPDMRLIVDTCIGNDKPRRVPDWNMMTTDFLTRLAQCGWARDSVDGILCTHLHVDHVGWNTIWENGRWVPTFPNAKYFMGRAELDFLTAQLQGDLADEEPTPFVAMMKDTRATYADSVKPIVDAGLATLVETDAEITPGVRLIPTPGHTPGHVSVLIESGDARAVITGDMMHSPCQIAHLDWSSAFDTDAAQSTQTRQAFCEEFADTGTLVIGTHFGGPTAGRLVRRGQEFLLEVDQ